MRPARSFFLVIAAMMLAPAHAAETSPEQAVAAARDWRGANGAQIVADFASLLSLPNDANYAQGVASNAAAVVALFASRGFAMEKLTQGDAPPLIYGERKTPGATRTIAIYVHYDGQPTEPADWTHPPFAPALYSRAMAEGGEQIPFPKAGEPIADDWRLYARSASDDKAPLIALAAAVDALDAAEIGFTSNIKLIFDGEEEAGSPHLAEYLAAYGGKYADVDLWLFCDGPTHQSGRPQLVFGVRGVTGLEVTVYGPNRGLHSGHYGNWAPGPGWHLAQLLAGMKDEKGRVLIKDFYKSADPITKADRAAIAAMPPVDDELRAAFGLAETEMNNAPIAERLLLPALNLKGLKSAEVGAASRNVIPPTATASIGLRLVKGNDPEKMLDLVEAHIARQGFHIVREDPDAAARAEFPLIAKVARAGGYPAVKSRMDDPAVAPLVGALRAAAGDELVLNPGLGGSLPLYMFESASDAPIVILPVANFDNNQHAADENIRIGNLFYAIDAYAAALTMAE